jgi:hypothetical protein
MTVLPARWLLLLPGTQAQSQALAGRPAVGARRGRGSLSITPIITVLALRQAHWQAFCSVLLT